MKVGKPLSDEDRKPWLKKLHDEIRSHSERCVKIFTSVLVLVYIRHNFMPNQHCLQR